MRYQLPFWATASLVLGCAAAPDQAAETTASDLEGAAPATITFAADWTTQVTGTLRAGVPIEVRYADERAGSCRSTQGGTMQWSTTGSAQVAGGAVQHFDAAGLVHGKSEITLPLGPGGDLTMWFETVGRYGCHEFDSAFGANYHFQIAEAANFPDWIGAASVVTSRATCDGQPCDQDRHDLSQGFVYDTWTRERAAIRRVDFRVWEPGLTDHDDADLWQKLDAEVHYRFGGQGDYQHDYVQLDARVGTRRPVRDATGELRSAGRARHLAESERLPGRAALEVRGRPVRRGQAGLLLHRARRRAPPGRRRNVRRHVLQLRRPFRSLYSLTARGGRANGLPASGLEQRAEGTC